MQLLYGFSAEQIQAHHMAHTASEIYRQPQTWLSIYEQIDQRRDEIKAFMQQFGPETQVIFTGAGSSGFIGDALAPLIKKESPFKHVASIHTTDIVATPDQYLVPTHKTLLVSFGRSGNSPESVAAVELAEQCIQEVYHLIITCNTQGKLAKFCNPRTLNLTFPEIEDLSFAMTSSVSGMMLAAYSIFSIQTDHRDTIQQLAAYADTFNNQAYHSIFNMVNEDIQRLVVLGSGHLYGAARESALKTTELTAGKIATRYDTPMGFRHGPKSFLDEQTVILYFLSASAYTQQYDLDMLQELSLSKKYKLVVVSDLYQPAAADLADLYLYNANTKALPEGFAPYMPLLVAQIFSLKAALCKGCTPDNPFPSGEVNRVVKGVTIHPYPGL